MAIQFDVASRNAMLDAIESTAGASCSLRIYTGAQPATCATANSGTVLADMDLPADWMSAAAAGVKAKLGTWSDTSANADGTAAHFRIYNSQATKDETTCFMQGSVGQGSGDLSLDDNTILATQVVTISTFSLTAPNA
jgi:alpha-D-ribose 1-methylphosphonate 5-triphosphate synthase subunit PhnH